MIINSLRILTFPRQLRDWARPPALVVDVGAIWAVRSLSGTVADGQDPERKRRRRVGVGRLREGYGAQEPHAN
jgi:hypothetical protein